VGEAFAMVQIQVANRPSDSRPQSGGRHADSFFQIEAWMPSEIKAISPLVNRLMRLIEGSRCVVGEEPAVKLALWEALHNAVVHGNRMHPHKLIQVYCHCDLAKGISLVVKDQGQGFDPNAVPDPTAVDNLEGAHGRGLWLMKSVMDEVSFERGGTEVYMRKAPAGQPRTECEPPTKQFPSVRQTEPSTAPPLSACERVDLQNERG
jgi:serine/threonine-protein kinase RsbW